jgi:hypothetical protein
MSRRLAIRAVLAGTLASALAGCSSAPTATATPTPPPGALPTPDPGDVLAAAVAKTTGVDLKVELTDSAGDHYTGSFDGIHKVGTLTQAPGGTGIRITVTPEDYYLSGLKTLKGQTWHLKIAELRDDSRQTIFTDILAPITLLNEATGVQSSDPGTFTGHVDASLLRGTTSGARKFLAHVNKSGSTNAQTLIFTATVSAQGYLTSFKTTFPALIDDKDVDYELKLSGFGTAAGVVIPTGGKVIEAPARAYATI